MLFPETSSASKYFLRDPARKMPSLGLVQSFWALTDREHSRAEALAEACDDGFEYLEVGLREERFAETRSLLKDFPLKLIAQGWAIDQAEASVFLQRALDFNAVALNLHLGHAYLSSSEAVDLIGAVQRRAYSLGMPLLLETHRGRLTQDLYRCANLLTHTNDVVIALDVSHYMVAGETFGGSEDLFHAHLAPLLARTALIHGRISNGQFIQVPTEIDPVLTCTFQGIWQKTMELWLEDAPTDAVLLFEPELGPSPYSYKVDGAELFDRSVQSRKLTDLAREAWSAAQANLTSLAGPAL